MPAEATMMGGCDFASENGRTVDAAFLDGADGKLDRKNDGFGAGFEHLV